jgi:hypothetical protein
MIRATIDVPRLHCREQFDESGNSEPYLWFAYLFADSTSSEVSVFVPPATNIRALIPDNVGNNQTVPIPASLGNFQINLEPEGLLGVLVILLEEDETPANAIAAGYAEFEVATRREINKFVVDLIIHGEPLRPPTEQEQQQIARAIANSVRETIKSHQNIFQQFFLNQDDFIGHSVSIFFGDALKEPATPVVTELGLPAIDADAFGVHFTSFNPLKFEIVKLGHHHYEFVRPLLRLEKFVGLCAEEANAFNDAVSSRKALSDQLQELKRKLAKAPEKELQAIRKQIEDLRTSKIPQADEAAEAARLVLQACHLRVGHAGNVG